MLPLTAESGGRHTSLPNTWTRADLTQGPPSPSNFDSEESEEVAGDRRDSWALREDQGWAAGPPQWRDSGAQHWAGGCPTAVAPAAASPGVSRGALACPLCVPGSPEFRQLREPPQSFLSFHFLEFLSLHPRILTRSSLGPPPPQTAHTPRFPFSSLPGKTWQHLAPCCCLGLERSEGAFPPDLPHPLHSLFLLTSQTSDSFCFGRGVG